MIRLARPASLLALGLVCIVPSGCVVGEALNAASRMGSGTFERIEKQRILERVARDWCLTIRASQVVPVYPLDEDVEVGDTYIVDTPIAQLKKYWRTRGYLPIDHRFGRLQPSGFAAYYHNNGYGVLPSVGVPRHWQFPAAEALPIAATATATEKRNWVNAPRAGFPSYSFRIKRGEGINVAIPVQGIPVAIAALGAREATGSVTLKDAYTYGIDEASLRRDLSCWSSRADVKEALKAYTPVEVRKRSGKTTIKYNFLRVITRVYLVRGVTVDVTNTSASAFKGSVGAPKGADKNLRFSSQDKPEDLLLARLQEQIASQELQAASTEADSEETADATTAAGDTTGPTTEIDPEIAAREADLSRQEKLFELEKREADLQKRRENQALAQIIAARSLDRQEMTDRFGGYQLPGGTLQVASASSDSISMNETFDRPLVIGYHALEFRIEKDGVLGGLPVSTFDRLDTGREPTNGGLLIAGAQDPTLKADLRKFFRESPENEKRAINWLRRNGVEENWAMFVQAGDDHYFRLQKQLAIDMGVRQSCQ